MKPNRKPFSTTMDVKLRKDFHERCDQLGLKIYVVQERMVRDWLAKHGDEAHG